LVRFWLGHANKSVTDGYSKPKEDVSFRNKVVEQVGTGFRLLAKKPERDLSKLVNLRTV